MQTFLPYPTYADSVAVLDMRRLGKQRVETQQIFNVIRKTKNLDVPKIMVNAEKPTSGKRAGWVTHPAVRMWIEYPLSLLLYGVSASQEFARRGGKDNLCPLFLKTYDLLCSQGHELKHPDWIGDNRVHSSHRGNLLRKDPVWYRSYGWIEPLDMPYFWPV